MKTSATRLFVTVLALCVLGMFVPGKQAAQAQATSAEEATKRLEEKGAKFLPRKEFAKNALVRKAKGKGGPRPFFSCSAEFCTCTGVNDCIDLGLNTNLCKLDTATCQQTAAGPSCVCSRQQP
jgi:hypothetical protein